MPDDERPQEGDPTAAQGPASERPAPPPGPAAPAGGPESGGPDSGKRDAAAPETTPAESSAADKPAAAKAAAPGGGPEPGGPDSGKRDAAAPQATPAGSSAADKPAAAKAAAAAPAARAKPAPPKAPPLPPDLEALRGRIGTLVEGAEADDTNDLMLGYVVPRERLQAACRRLRDDFACDYLSCLSGVDYPEYVEVVYHLFSTGDPAVKVVVKTRAPKTPQEDCAVPSVTAIWPGADWHEREAFDLLGVVFEGHPDLRRLLLPEDFAGGYPLRKDFADVRAPKERKIRVR